MGDENESADGYYAYLQRVEIKFELEKEACAEGRTVRYQRTCGTAVKGCGNHASGRGGEAVPPFPLEDSRGEKGL